MEKDKTMKNVLDVLGEQDPNTMIMSKFQLKYNAGLGEEGFKQQIKDLISRGLVKRFTTEHRGTYVDYYALTHYGHDTYIKEACPKKI